MPDAAVPSFDATDRAILAALQDGFPLAHRPFSVAGRALGLDEEELIDRIRNLREEGTITRFGPFFDVEAMGGAFCLCAMAVPADRFVAVAALVNARPEVIHSLERDHRLNLWFVLASDRAEAIGRAARDIAAESGLGVLRLPRLADFSSGSAPA